MQLRPLQQIPEHGPLNQPHIIRFCVNHWFSTDQKAVVKFKRICKDNLIPYSKRKCLFHKLGDVEYVWYFLSNDSYNLLRLLLPQDVQSKMVEYDRVEKRLKK